MTNTIIPIGEEIANCGRALCVFLAEKERRSGPRGLRRRPCREL